MTFSGAPRTFVRRSGGDQAEAERGKYASGPASRRIDGPVDLLSRYRALPLTCRPAAASERARPPVFTVGQGLRARNGIRGLRATAPHQEPARYEKPPAFYRRAARGHVAKRAPPHRGDRFFAAARRCVQVPQTTSPRSFFS